MKIQSKLFMFALLCSVLPLLAVFGISVNVANDTLSTTVKETLQVSTIEELNLLQKRMVETKHQLTTLSLLLNMQNVKPEGDIQALQQDINRFAKRTPLFAEIIAIDLEGQAVASSLGQSIDTNLSDTWEFESPKLGVHYDGPVSTSHRLNKTVASHSVPLYNDENPDEIIGVLIGAIDWSYLKKGLATHKIFGGDQNERRLMFLESTRDNVVLYGTEGFAPPVDLFQADSGNAQVRRVTYNDGDYMMVSINSQAIAEYRDPQWRLHVLIDSELAFAGAEVLRNNIILAGAPVMLFVLALSYLFANSIVTPVKALLQGAEKLSSGDYDYKLRAGNDADEIGQLTTSFNSMRIAIRKNEQELVKKTRAAEQAAKVKGEFLANMSHEVRTPINGVLGMTELLLNTPLDSKQTRYAETISRSGQALLSVINDILDFSKIEAGKLDLSDSAFDLRELAEDVVEMLVESAHRKGVEMILRMPPDFHVAYNGDGNRLRQILTNLVGNAVKFTHEGQVEICISETDTDDDKTLLRFDVVDTGIGIAESQHQTVFDSFVQADGTTTRQYGGTGLGLSISGDLVELMGGTIGMHSKPGQGSTFWFTASLTKLSTDVEKAWLSTDALAGKHVLVVDDNTTNREILTAQVEFWGATSVSANSAEKAIQALDETLISGHHFDAAILDMQMPSMNGLQLAAVIHERRYNKDMCVALLSSSCDSLNAEECQRLGIQTLAIKPVRQHDLYNALTAVMVDGIRPDVSKRKVAKVISGNVLQGNVLLAEDNTVNQDMMLEMLRQLGVTAELAINGKDAVDAAREKQFDAILMDCQMPVMDGFEATAAIRRYENKTPGSSHSPIIALTANAMEPDREMCLASGMDEYLDKPVSYRQLREMLSRWLEEKTAEQKLNDTTTVDHQTQPCVEETGLSAQQKTAVPAVLAAPVTPKEDHRFQSAKPVLDEAVFNEVCTMCEQAPPGFFASLLEKYLESSTEDLQSLTTAVSAGDNKEVGATAHRLKSSSANWGGQRLADACQALESAGKSDSLANGAQLLKKIEMEHQQLLSALRRQETKAA